MKKTITLILSVLLLISALLISCDKTNESLDSSDATQNETSPEETKFVPKVTALTSYKALRYDSDDAFDYKNIIREKNVPKKEIDVLNSKGVAYYSHTETYSDRPYNIISYDYSNSADPNSKTVYVNYRTDTDQVVRYNQTIALDANYKSDVNPQSSQEEYLAYAKKILLDEAGISLDGWKIKVNSSKVVCGAEYQFVGSNEARYINTYTFTFYKTISGIQRCDKTTITITNMGEVVFFEVMPNDEAFAPYKNVKIDFEKVKESVLDACQFVDAKKQITGAQLVTNEDGLWVEVYVEYNYDGAFAGMIFVVQVAEIEKDPALSANKVETTKPSLDASTTTEWFPDEE